MSTSHLQQLQFFWQILKIPFWQLHRKLQLRDGGWIFFTDAKETFFKRTPFFMLILYMFSYI